MDIRRRWILSNSRVASRSGKRRENTITARRRSLPFPRVPRHVVSRHVGAIFRFPAGFPHLTAWLSRGITREHLADARVPSIAASRGVALSIIQRSYE